MDHFANNPNYRLATDPFGQQVYINNCSTGFQVVGYPPNPQLDACRLFNSIEALRKEQQRIQYALSYGERPRSDIEAEMRQALATNAANLPRLIAKAKDLVQQRPNDSMWTGRMREQFPEVFGPFQRYYPAPRSR